MIEVPYFDEDDAITVNVSAKEATAGPREALPAGKYLVAVTDVEMRESKSQKNPGKPFYNFEFTIQEGEHAEKTLYTSAMLWSGALYTITSMMKAVGLPVAEGELKIPGAEWWVGQQFVVTVKKKQSQEKVEGSEPAKYVPAWEDPDTKKKPIWTNEVRGFASADSWQGVEKTASTNKTASLLP